MRKIDDAEMVSASEIASYCFCPEAWRLGSELGLRPNNERELTRGEKSHAKIAVVEANDANRLVGWSCVARARGSARWPLPVGERPMTAFLVILGLLALIFGAVLLFWSSMTREKEGLGAGETLALDDLVIVSERLKILGRPDRIVRQGEFLIPEEWKPSARRIYPGHRLQLGAYLLLIEEEFDVRPPYGVVVLADGERVEVENTEELRAEVLAVAAKIREHRRNIEREIPVRQPAAKCRGAASEQTAARLAPDARRR